MTKKVLFTVLSLCFSLLLFAQKTYRITGKVTNSKLEPLAFVSIQLKQSQFGTITKEDGSYVLNLEEGTYDFMVSIIGYKQQIIRLTVTRDYVQNIIMEDDDVKNSMEDIVIRVKIRDRSEEIIKNTIRAKEQLMNAAGPYSVKMYIKAVQQDSAISKKDRGKTDTSTLTNPNAGFDDMAMAEVLLKVDRESEQRIKEERLAVKKTGNSDYFYYLSSTAGDFNFYNNLVKVPSISQTPFLSPVSYSGLIAYKYKMIRIEKRNDKRVYIISVKPREISNATVEGEITIQDSSWAILHTRFRFPSYHLTEYDFFEVEQHYQQEKDSAWVLARQTFNYYAKSSKKKFSGQTLVLYSDYELNKKFPSRYFGDEVSATAQEAYEKDSSFWSTVRTEPLTDRELRYIRYKDSIFRVTHTEAYLDSLDRLNNRITLSKILFTGQLFYNRKQERTWLMPSLISMIEPLGFGGVRLSPTFYYYQKYVSRKDVKVYGKVSYGFYNKDINGAIGFQRIYNPFNRGSFAASIVRSFDPIYDRATWASQLRRTSYFQNNYVALGHGLEILNGLSIYTEGAVAMRRSVNGYNTPRSIDEIIKGSLDSNNAVSFDPYNGAYAKLVLRFTPKQRYIREPREKIILGSRWPTFVMNYNKGIPGIFNSQINYDYLEFGMEQQISFGLLGNMRYSIKTGDFLSKRSLKLLEYSYQRRGDPLFFMNPDDAFQALDSTFAVFERSYTGHMVHEFNGAIINKIPLLKKLKLREVAGAGFLIAPERSLTYAEMFVGIERVFKWPLNPLQKIKLGIYAVTSVANQFKNPVQFKIGFTTWDFIRNKWN